MMALHVVVKFEWDEAKRLENLRKHGIDFADLPPLFEGATVTILDDRVEYEKDRFVTFGLLREYVVTVAHTEDEQTIRFISARKATKREEEQYFKAIADPMVPPEEDEG
jgi:uncharacterized DUF497 family protein